MYVLANTLYSLESRSSIQTDMHVSSIFLFTDSVEPQSLMNITKSVFIYSLYAVT